MRAKLKAVIFLLFIALGIGYVFLLTWQNSNTYYVSIDKNFNMSDEELIAVARQCLELDGLDVSSFRPSPFWNDSEEVVARNELDKNRAHVLWSNMPDPTHSNYYVVMDKQPNNRIKCIVGQPH